MTRSRSIVIVFALGIIGVGFLVTFVPGLALGGGHSALLSLLGLIALFQGLRVGRDWFHSDREVTDLPDTDHRDSHPVPGTDVDALFATFISEDDAAALRAWDTLRKRLETTAVTVLRQAYGWSEATAHEQLQTGSWTTNQYAAAFFATDITSHDRLGTQLRTAMRARPDISRRATQARHVVAALGQLTGTSAPLSARDSRDTISDTGTDSLPSAPENAMHRSSVDDTSASGSPPDSSETDTDVETDTETATQQWRGVSAFAVVALAVSLLITSPPLVLASATASLFSIYQYAATPPAVSVVVDRVVSDPQPEPGTAIDVTVMVTNTGDAILPDLRLADGVPPGLAVTDGTAQATTVLRPGATTTFTYTVTATRGEHEFEPVHVLAYGVTGAIERAVRVADPTTITCIPVFSPDSDAILPLRQQTTPLTGTVTATAGGAGAEFYGVREYRSGDPTARIDWNHLASTGDLATLEYREERAATVVVLIDAREAAYRAPQEAPSAVERSIEAAGQTAAALLDDSNLVGMSALAPTECWLAPSAGESQAVRARALLGSHPAFSVRPPATPYRTAHDTMRLRSQLPADAQLVLCSPCCDDHIVAVAQRLEASGHRVTVISPDPTVQGDGSIGQQLARLERATRLERLRTRGIPVLDWAADESFGVAALRAEVVMS